MNTYLDVITKYIEESQKNNRASFFRGQGSFGWPLKPSLFRNCNWIINEHTMIEEMIRHFPSFLNDSRRIDILTKLQHYGLPTRLLDLTKNPLVALFFACIERETKGDDGRVFYFSPSETETKYTNSDTVAILANLSKRNSTFGTNNLKTKKELGKFLSFCKVYTRRIC